MFGLFIVGGCLAWAQQPNAEDLVWQKSVRKFDGARKSILQQVDGEAHAVLETDARLAAGAHADGN